MESVATHVPLFSYCPLTSKGQAANQEGRVKMLSPRSHQEKKAHRFVLIFLAFDLLVRNKHSRRRYANRHLERIQVSVVNISKPWLTWTPALWNTQQAGTALDAEISSVGQN